MDLPEGFASYSLLNGADICREGTGHFRSSCKQKWKSNWSEQNKLRGVIFPSISTPNDYLDTVVDDVVSLRWSKKKCLPTVPLEKFQFDGILSLRVKSLSLQDDKEGMLFVDRPVK